MPEIRRGAGEDAPSEHLKDADITTYVKSEFEWVQ